MARKMKNKFKIKHQPIPKMKQIEEPARRIPVRAEGGCPGRGRRPCGTYGSPGGCFGERHQSNARREPRFLGRQHDHRSAAARIPRAQRQRRHQGSAVAVRRASAREGAGYAPPCMSAPRQPYDDRPRGNETSGIPDYQGVRHRPADVRLRNRRHHGGQHRQRRNH